MKTVAKFYGIVNEFNSPPAPSYVTLTNAETGEKADTNAISAKLLEKGIDHVNCEFEVVIQESLDGKVEAILTKIEPKKLPKEQIQKILDDVGDVEI